MTASHKLSDIAHQIGEGLESAVSGVPDIGSDIKRALVLDIKDSGCSRDEIAIQLSARAGRAITVAQLDAYTAETKVNRFPAELVPDWVLITRSTRMLHILCRAAGCYLASQTDHELAQLGRVQLQREKTEQQLSELKGRLWHKI